MAALLNSLWIFNGRFPGNRLAEDRSDMVGEVGWRLKAAKSPGVDVRYTDARGLTQRFQSRLLLGFPAFNQSKPVTQYFAGILVSPRGYEFFDQSRLVVRENDVAGWHGEDPLPKTVLADYAIKDIASDCRMRDG